MKRRTFVKHSGILSVGALNLLHCKAKKMSGVGKIGIQLWSVREAMAKDAFKTLQTLADIGYKDVEMAGYFNGEYYGVAGSEFKKYLDDLGLEMQSGHCSTGKTDPKNLRCMSKDWKAACEDAVAMGQKAIVLGYISEEERKSFDGYKELADLLNKSGEVAKEYGLQLGYHNHDFEFMSFDGIVAYDYLLDNTEADLVNFELDHYWVKKGNANSLELLNKYPGRFPFWHVKDMDNTEERYFTEVGSGVIDYKEIFKEKTKSKLQFFYVEQDAFKTLQPLESVEKSHDYLRQLEI